MEHDITIPRALLERALDALDMSRRFVYQDNRPQVDAAFDALRAELAKPTATAWHDAPTCDGLWVCNEGDNNPYRWTTHRVTFPLNQLLVGKDERWFGPIPREGEKS